MDLGAGEEHPAKQLGDPIIRAPSDEEARLNSSPGNPLQGVPKKGKLNTSLENTVTNPPKTELADNLTF